MMKNYSNQSLSSKNVVGRRIKLTQQIPAGGLGFLGEGEEFEVIASAQNGVCIRAGKVSKDPIILQQGSYEFVG